MINIKKKDNKCFLWCHTIHLNRLKIDPERKAKADKIMIDDLDYKGIKFHVSKKDYCKIEQKNNTCLNAFCYENVLSYLVYVSDRKFENCMDLYLITEEKKHQYMYITNFNRFMCNKTKNENEKHFCKCCLQFFCSEKVSIEHKENCLKINGKQSLKLKSGSIEFENHSKQLAVPSKTYADFQCNVKGVKTNNKNNTLYTGKNQDHIPCSFAYKAVCIDNKFSTPAVYRFIEPILKEKTLFQKK